MIEFTQERSSAIRAALIARAATAGVAGRRRWRGLSLVMAGVLAGTGATTAAFASGSIKPLTPPASPGATAEGASVSIFRSDEAGASDDVMIGLYVIGDHSPGDTDETGEVVSVLELGSGAGEVRIELAPNQGLRQVGLEHRSLAEPSTLELGSTPSNAELAMVTVSCRERKGQIVLTPPSGETTTIVGGLGGIEPTPGMAGGGGRFTVAFRVRLADGVSQVKPIGGCVADVSVVYYAKG